MLRSHSEDSGASVSGSVLVMTSLRTPWRREYRKSICSSSHVRSTSRTKTGTALDQRHMHSA